MSDNPWKRLVDLLDELCACYRLRTIPSGKLLDQIRDARKEVQKFEESNA